MKHMLKFARFKYHLPLVFAFLGEALLLFAWRLSDGLSNGDTEVVFAACEMLWFCTPLALLLYVIRKGFPKKTSLRYALIFTLLVLSVVPFKEWAFRTIFAQTLSVIGVFLLVSGLLYCQRLHPALRLLNRLIQKHRALSPRQFFWGAFSTILGICIYLSWYCFDFHPAYTDSTAQYVHGKFVASGHLFYVIPHALSDFFPVWMMVGGAKWYSQYPPMHQTLIGIGHMLGAPWLINPLEGAITLAAVYGIAKRAYGESVARLASVFIWLSPFVILMSSEFMNHSSALLFTTLTIYSYGEWLHYSQSDASQKRIRYWALAVGIGAGCAFLSRPLTAIGTCAPFILHATYRLWKDTKTQLNPFLIMAAGGIVCVLFQMWFNYETTGDVFTYAYARYHMNSVARAMGFYNGSNISYTLLKMHTDWNNLNINLFEWSLPCTFFIWLLCLRPQHNIMTKLLIGVVVSQTIGNMFNQFNSAVFGPRYMYEASSALIILTALGVHRLPVTLKLLRLPLPDKHTTQGLITLVVIMVFATGLINHIPKRIREFSHFFDSHPQFLMSMYYQSEHPALIFVGRQDIDPKNPPRDPAAKFRWTAWTNPPMDDAPVIYAYDRGDLRNKALIEYYPNRHAYVEYKDKLIPVDTTKTPAPATTKAKP